MLLDVGVQLLFINFITCLGDGSVSVQYSLVHPAKYFMLLSFNVS